MPAFWTFTVVDLEETVRWYTGCLGFIELFRMPARPGSAELAHLRRRRYQDILVTCGRPESPGPWLTLAATTEELLEAASAVMVSGVGAVHPPVATAWNTVDLHLSDPDGHRLSLTAPQDEHSQDRDADVDTVMLPAATGQQALPGQR